MKNIESDLLLKSMLNKNLSDAKDIANFNGYNLNVVGDGTPICFNFDFYRINVYVEDGVVKKCYFG